MIDAIRYYLALITVVAWPGAVAFWLIVHPLIGLWRRTGLVVPYALSAIVAVVIGVFLFQARDVLLAVEFGSHRLLIGLGIAVFAVGFALDLWVRRGLNIRTLIGVPELRGESEPGVLLTDGPYRFVRHPRYAVLIVAFLGIALFTNYLALYVTAVAIVPALYLIAWLEERELIARFGEAYRDYMRRTPRFLPFMRPK